MFKIPLNVTLTRQVKQLIQSIDFFILGEASMTTIKAIKVINAEVKDVYNTK
jgi:hypothetical protein